MACDPQEVNHPLRTNIISDQKETQKDIEEKVIAIDDNARKSIEELLKILIATSGVILTLLWGLTQRTSLINKDIFRTIRLSSFILVIAIAAAFFSYQFSITGLHKNLKAVKEGRLRNEISTSRIIGGLFFISWVSFLVACAFLLRAMWKIKFVVSP
jgi:hypothetical protein